jgi:hypothetical protein
MDTFVNAALIGTGATALMDLWGILRQRLFGIPNMNYGLVGRWIAWMPRGRFRHERIAATPAVKGEKAIGWAAHYAIGIAFAAALLAIYGIEWARQPSLAPALIVGIATVAAPFLVMQPAMGAGIAASRTPRPNAARLQSLVTHTVFGFGLYAAGLLLNLLKG